MGIIQRQGAKHTIVNFIGVAIGLLSTIFIYPRATEVYGLAQMVLSSSTILMSFFLLGFNVISIRFFPDFKDHEKGHHGFLGFLLSGGLVGFLLFLLFLPLVRYLLVDLLFLENENRALFADYFYFIVPVVFLFIINYLFLRYISNFHRVVVPTIFDQLFIKISLPILILLYLAEVIDLKMFFVGIIANYVIALIGYIWYTKRLGQWFIKPDWAFITKPLQKKMRSYGQYGILNALGSQLAFRIDTLMVGGMISLATGGVYAIANVIIEVITKPAKAITAIASPIISESWAKNDLKEIETIYKKSSITLLIFGAYIFLGIWLSVDDLFAIMPNTKEVSAGKYVIFFLGLAKLFDLATSVNSQIIAYSSKFKFNFYAILVLAVLNIIFNLIFIPNPKLGLVGAALATFCSLGLFNLGKLLFIWFQFGIQPFTRNTILLILVALGAGVISWFLPLDFHPIVNIGIRSTVLSLCYLLPVFWLSLSSDFNSIVINLWNKIFTS